MTGVEEWKRGQLCVQFTEFLSFQAKTGSSRRNSLSKKGTEQTAARRPQQSWRSRASLWPEKTAHLHEENCHY